jgi:cytochrome c peroxidase
MSIVNVGYGASLTWANSVLTTLERQALVPLFADQPVELGMSGRDGVLLARLRAAPRYPALFAAAFPERTDPFSLDAVLKALAAFQRDLSSLAADYDHYLAGDEDALADDARRGLALFASPRLACTRCHDGPLLSNAMALPEQGSPALRFENNGLYASYPKGNQGLIELTGRAEDDGFFKPPSLRNVAVTAPYMHDGSLPTLDAVLDHYARGGAAHPLKSEHVRGFVLSAGERADLLAFLHALTDERVLNEPRWADPWRTR